MAFRTPYDGKPVKIRTIFTKPSMAVPYEKESCDINRIMNKYQKTGLIDHVSRYQGRYGDFASVPDYQTAMHVVIAANEAFDSLPSNLRDRFNNDPEKFFAFVHDKENLDEMKKMGLIAPAVEPVIPVVRIMPEKEEQSIT
ncbi:MAG: scaffolding protein [Geobacteraceae bacterium]|nr:scaffolding protein [Geobacteraceae bacterium]